MKIAVVTGTRAEYGLLYWLMKAIQADSILHLQLIVTGAHLQESSGGTIKNIINDGFNVDYQVPIGLEDDSPFGISNAIGICTSGFARAYSALDPDMLVVLGDRYEILAAASAALPFNIPIAHIHGGESTEGAIDEQIRHAITKMSHLHFASTERYRERIIQMGEEPWRVYNVGALGIESILKLELLTKEQLEAELELYFDRPTFVATFHPATLDYKRTDEYLDNLLCALKSKHVQVIFTGANNDTNGRRINERLEMEAQSNRDIKFFMNLGQKKYFSLLQYCDAMIGNSSSGIIEASSFELPVINIGERQRGRIKGKNIFDCDYNRNDIEKAISNVLEGFFTKKLMVGMENPYGDGTTSSRIVDAIRTCPVRTILLNKRLNYEQPEMNPYDSENYCRSRCKS